MRSAIARWPWIRLFTLLALRGDVGKQRYNYDACRPAQNVAQWTEGTKDNYPYQERVLNNLPLPLALAQHQTGKISEWLAEGLGIKEYSAQTDRGLFPDDSIFVRTDLDTGELESYAPNLLLFRHRTLPLVPDVNVQTIAFEYDLPFSAQVTITLVLHDQTELPLCSRAGVAGWNQHYCRADVRLQNGDAYRIRAERGNPEQPTDHYLGQYLQRFSFADLPLQAQNISRWYKTSGDRWRCSTATSARAIRARAGSPTTGMSRRSPAATRAQGCLA